jgi:hypothetical protein
MYATGNTPWMVWNHTLNHHAPHLAYRSNGI